jgi:alpha-galactosidase
MMQKMSSQIEKRDQWFQHNFTSEIQALPFSFVYDDKSSAELLPTWDCQRSVEQIDEFRTQTTFTYTDPQSGLQLRCEIVQHTDFPTIEWTVYIKNTGAIDTPILENIQALNTLFERKESEPWVLHYFKGDSCTKDSFEPIDLVMRRDVWGWFAPTDASGFGSNGCWPYYNLEWDGGGTIMAIGWPGQWASAFGREGEMHLRVRAGQQQTRFKLLPGEEVRSPRIALMFYEGDWIASQNLWRRWIFTHVFPKDHGKRVAPKLSGFCGNWLPGYVTNQASEIEYFDRYFEEGMPLDYWWMDTGWFIPCRADWWVVGTWEVDRERYPGGLRAISDHAHANGAEYVLWFEPERVTTGTWLWDNKPEWILRTEDPGAGVLNLGNPDARQWMLERLDSLIDSEGVDVYRQDCNIFPLNYWRANDTKDRQGITENHHITGLLAMWDELQRRHPGMLFDQCSGGGRRDDFEMMRRAVPFLRSDYCMDPEGMQCHTYGFNLWLPYYRGAFDIIDHYTFHSNLSPLMMLAWDMAKPDLDYDLARKLVKQWHSVKEDFFGDFYPLTPYGTADNIWMAFQFDRSENGTGFVQAFRRGHCPDSTLSLKLKGLKPEASYVLIDLDTGKKRTLSGQRLMEKGLTVCIDGQPGASLLRYECKPQS